MTDHDVIVLGVGGVGSATVSELARRGADVLGLERFDVPHARGSSHGETRIIRLAYHESPYYVPLLRRAYDRWQALEERTGERLLHRTGSLSFGPAGSDAVAGARETCEIHDIDHEVLTGAEVTERFPAYELPDEYRAVYQPDGGYLTCERCVRAHVRDAIDHGATVRARERATDWESTPEGVRVETDRGTHTADRLVVTAGAWAARFVPELREHLVPERHVTTWLQPTEPGAFAPESFPVFVADAESLGHFYGFPVHDLGFKLGGHREDPPTVDPETADLEPRVADEEPLRAFVREFLPGGDGPTLRTDRCLITRTPDDDFVLDTHPGNPDVVVGAGFSGHGFKLAPASGAVLADLALDGETDHDVSRFALDRFD